MILGVVAFLWFAVAPAAAATGTEPLIEQSIESIRANPPAQLSGDTIASPMLLPEMYDQRAFQSLWGNAAMVEALLEAIRHSEDDGLNPQDYHLAVLDRLKAAGADDAQGQCRCSI